MISLIGITGPARHGKDTVGAMIMKHIPACVRFAFADKFKEFLTEAFVTTHGPEVLKEGEQLFTTTFDELDTAVLNVLHKVVGSYGDKDYVDSFLTVLARNHEDYEEIGEEISFTSSWRKLYQLTGTDWGRKVISEDIWITPYLPDNHCIITDVRGHGDNIPHRNIEATAIINKGGVVVKVVDPRKGCVVRDHVSEIGIDDQYITHTIVNEGTLEDLHAKVVEFISNSLIKR